METRDNYSKKLTRYPVDETDLRGWIRYAGSLKIFVVLMCQLRQKEMDLRQEKLRAPRSVADAAWRVMELRNLPATLTYSVHAIRVKRPPKPELIK